MTLTGLFVDVGTAAADFNGLAAVALIGRNESGQSVHTLPMKSQIAAAW
jgi:hypothetical protein